MKIITKTINNEQGFVLIASLMMLMVLMVIGIDATNTTTIELQISGNDKLAKQVFYQAEGAVAEAVRIIGNDSSSALEESGATAPYQWLQRNPVGTGILTGSELNDVHGDAIWGSTTGRMAGASRGIAPGGSLDLGSSRMHLYDIYGRSQQNNALAIIKVGCRVPF